MATKTECDRCKTTTTLKDGWKLLRLSTLSGPLASPMDMTRELCPRCADEIERKVNTPPSEKAREATR